MKKLITILLLAAMVFALVGCGEGGTPASGNGDVDVVSDSGENGAASDSGNGGENGGASASLGDVKAGDYVTFGSYEQDGNAADGAEPIEWLVLDVQQGSALLVSRYALDGVAYSYRVNDNKEVMFATWENSEIREWLNGDFFKTAFGASEQAAVQLTKIVAEKNPEYDTDAGADTEDRVFLLSVSEAQKYFPTDAERMCAPTDYALDRGIYTKDEHVGERPTCTWYLRTPGAGGLAAAGVNRDGSIDLSGPFITWKDVGARPAIWVKL